MQKKLHFKINNSNFEWNEQFISGLQVKQLGGIPSDVALYLRQKGQNEDLLISNNDQVDLSEPGIEKFYTKQTSFVIIVNTREELWQKETISYDELIVLAYGQIDSNKAYTVTYSKGPKENREGVMVKSQSVYVTNNMIFNVTGTVQS